jgi:hypothetical protein
MESPRLHSWPSNAGSKLGNREATRFSLRHFDAWEYVEEDNGRRKGKEVPSMGRENVT